MDDKPSSFAGQSSLWQRLRERKVVQWGLVYVAVAWGVLQGIGFVADAFAWPPVTKQVATIVMAIGFGLVIVFAWFHGDRGQQRVGAVEVALVVALLAGGGALTWYLTREHAGAQPATAAVDNGDTRPARSSVHPTIAVLAFENRSASPDDAYFVEGVHDDILMQLSKIGSMTVIARTSVEALKSKALSVAEIARELSASNVLEGAVQRAGNRVRVQVRLVETRGGTQVWAESYDRELNAANLFAIQSEVATSIAEALAFTLTPAERGRINTVPTPNLDAWQAYQLGEQRLSKRTVVSLGEAARFYQQAIDLDPNFALAYVGLANATWLEADYSNQPYAPAQERAEKLLDRALSLDPELPEGLVTKAKFLLDRGSLVESERQFRKAIALKPSYPQAYTWYAQLLYRQGRRGEAVQNTKRAVELDPMSVYQQANYAYGLGATGRLDEAQARFKRIQEIDPQSPGSYTGLGSIQMSCFGRYDLAVPLLERAAQLGGERDTLVEAYIDLGDLAAAERALRNTDRSIAASVGGAYLALVRGETTTAIRRASAVIDSDPANAAALAMLRLFDLKDHRPQVAHQRYVRGLPGLSEPGGVDDLSYPLAIDLAVVLQRLGDAAGAARLLDRAAVVVARNQRLGPWGYGLSDAQIEALRGHKDKALALLTDAVREGWRGPLWRYYRDFDPNLDSIRAEPAFRAAFLVVEEDMNRQRQALGRRS